MPTSDFKREPMLRRIKSIWNENNGNWLLVTSLAVSLLAWSVGYFDLIPEISTRGPSNAASSGPFLIAAGRTLNVKVIGCESDEGTVVAMLFAADRFDVNSVPLRVETLEIKQLQATWAIHNLTYGAYVVVAFHDLNGDDQFNPDSERQGFSRRSGSLRSATTDGRTVEVSDAAFNFDQDQQEVVVELKD